MTGNKGVFLFFFILLFIVAISFSCVTGQKGKKRHTRINKSNKNNLIKKDSDNLRTIIPNSSSDSNPPISRYSIYYLSPSPVDLNRNPSNSTSTPISASVSVVSGISSSTSSPPTNNNNNSSSSGTSSGTGMIATSIVDTLSHIRDPFKHGVASAVIVGLYMFALLSVSVFAISGTLVFVCSTVDCRNFYLGSKMGVDTSTSSSTSAKENSKAVREPENWSHEIMDSMEHHYNNDHNDNGDDQLWHGF